MQNRIPATGLNGNIPRFAGWTAFMILLVAFAGRAVFITQPPNSDTAMFVYMGKLVVEGKQIGVDLIDNKLPSVGLLMSLPYMLIGSAWWGYAVLGMVMMVIAPLMLARSAGRVLGSQAVIPVALAGAIWLNFPLMVYGLLQLETIQVFFVILSACAGLELLKRGDWRDAACAGLCAGLAMWAKPTAGAILPAMMIAILFCRNWTWQRRITAVAMLGAGMLIPILVCIGLLHQTGMLSSLPATFAQLKEYSSNSTGDWFDLFKPVSVLMVLGFPILVWGYIFRRDKIVRPESDQTIYRVVAIFALAWLAMETIGVISQRRMYAYHFLPMAAPASLLVGLFARRMRTVSIGFAFGPAALITAIFVGQILSWPDPQARMAAVIRYVSSHAAAGDSAWLDDYPRMMVETDLSPGSRVPLTFLFGNSDQSPIRFGGIILEDLQQRQPEWVVLYHDVDRYVAFYQTYMAEMAAYPKRRENFSIAWREIDSFVRSNYVRVSQIDGMDVMRRIEGSANQWAGAE